MRRLIIAALVLGSLAIGSFAQRGRPAQSAAVAKVDDDETAALRMSKALPSKAKAEANASATPRSYSYADWEVWRDVTIAPGESVNLDSGISFTTADTARVSIRSRNADLREIVMNAYWAMPQAEFFNVAEIVTGDTFPYRNVGGATFTTYGNQFRLRLTNTGTSTMYLAQVVVFARTL
jgi:hypothetical protein